MGESLTSVCTMRGRCMRRSYTTPYTSTVFSISICWIRRSMAMNVPVLPTPALQRHGQAVCPSSQPPPHGWHDKKPGKDDVSCYFSDMGNKSLSSTVEWLLPPPRGASQPCPCTGFIYKLSKGHFFQLSFPG